VGQGFPRGATNGSGRTPILRSAGHLFLGWHPQTEFVEILRGAAIVVEVSERISSPTDALKTIIGFLRKFCLRTDEMLIFCLSDPRLKRAVPNY
jgi:hypothetical protein